MADHAWLWTPSHRLYAQPMTESQGGCICGWKAPEGIKKFDARELFLGHITDTHIDDGHDIDPFEMSKAIHDQAND